MYATAALQALTLWVSKVSNPCPDLPACQGWGRRWHPDNGVFCKWVSISNKLNPDKLLNWQLPPPPCSHTLALEPSQQPCPQLTSWPGWGVLFCFFFLSRTVRDGSTQQAQLAKEERFQVLRPAQPPEKWSQRGHRWREGVWLQGAVILALWVLLISCNCVLL